MFEFLNYLKVNMTIRNLESPVKNYSYWLILSCDAVFTAVVTEEIRAFNPRLNASAAALVRKGNLSGFLVDETAHLDAVDQQRLRVAVAFCKKIGFPVDEYPIIVSGTMGASLLGLADGGKIYISKRAFHQGTKMVAGTLIEEFLHLRNGVHDETRQMQNLLIDTICSLGERITRKPL